MNHPNYPRWKNSHRLGRNSPKFIIDRFIIKHFLALLSVSAFYLGGANAILARFAGTCTQGDADRLFGAVLSIILYCIALIALHFAKNRRVIFLCTLPLWPIWIWLTIFTLQLSSALLVSGQTACSFLEGIPYPESGNEVLFATLWILMTLSSIIGGLCVWRSRKQVSNGN